MIKIIDNEVLLSARFGFSPRAGDSCIELKDQVSVVAHSLAPSVQGFADTKAGAECTGAGYPKERRAVHYRWREFDARNWSACVLRYLYGVCINLASII